MALAGESTVGEEWEVEVDPLTKFVVSFLRCFARLRLLLLLLLHIRLPAWFARLWFVLLSFVNS